MPRSGPPQRQPRWRPPARSWWSGADAPESAEGQGGWERPASGQPRRRVRHAVGLPRWCSSFDLLAKSGKRPRCQRLDGPRSAVEGLGDLRLGPAAPVASNDDDALAVGQLGESVQQVVVGVAETASGRGSRRRCRSWRRRSARVQDRQRLTMPRVRYAEGDSSSENRRCTLNITSWAMSSLAVLDRVSSHASRTARTFSWRKNSSKSGRGGAEVSRPGLLWLMLTPCDVSRDAGSVPAGRGQPVTR